MKNASAKQIEVIEYLKTALNPKAFFSTIGDILVRTSSDSKLTDADREVAQIWEDNKASKKAIEAWEAREKIPEKGATGGKGKGTRKQKSYEISTPVHPQEPTREAMESKDTHKNSSKGFEIGE